MPGLHRIFVYVLLGSLVFAFALTPRASHELALARQSEPHAEAVLLITEVLGNQQVAWNRGAIDAFLQGYWHSQALTFAGSGGIKRGWDEVRTRYLKNYPDRAAMGKLEFSGLEFRFFGADAALVLGRWHLTREKGDLAGVFSLVFQRFPEGWKIVHDHTSVVPPAEKP